MKTSTKFLKNLLLFAWVVVLTSCNKDEASAEPEQTDGIYGKWEVVSGEILINDAKYIYINTDDTFIVQSEDNRGFRDDYKTNITVTDIQITISAWGTSIYNYTLEGNELTLIPPYDSPPILLRRIANDNEADNWIERLSILDQGNVPWGRDMDITFDGEFLLGYHGEDGNILQINPNDFSIAGTIPSTTRLSAVEIEKSDSSYRQLFLGGSGSGTFDSFLYSSNSLYYTSIPVGAYIRGIASIEPGQLWLNSHNEEKLYKYKSNGALSPGEILETIDLGFQPNGMDYRDGYLYMVKDNKIFKCTTSSGLRAVETYSLDYHEIDGITFDGTNFWLNAESYEEEGYKLIKVDLGV
ncbi:hypothetical protein HPE56_06105 [Maribacter sp. ANRC-HE7]|uniref:Lipocalin-like domain-containing protein n=1 Tax=Maribacter aquimaris TaxID=2737171 RepID=A0ABR7UXX1_9FLAO|nr:hypothetical protein [Maribacter aquimaris]MBD0777358.1 hypothetical protein [Maribacter aquimaris]